MIKIIKQTLYTQYVDNSTGEIFEETREFLDDTIKVPKKVSRKSKKIEDTDPTPKLTLLDNKIQFNNAAIELTGFEPEMKIDVKFEKVGRVTTPVICEDTKAGNRLSKTYTISFRGSRHDNLVEYGTVFELIPYEGKEGFFKLKGDAPEKEDDIIDIPEEIEDPENIDEDDVMSSDDFDLDFD